MKNDNFKNSRKINFKNIIDKTGKLTVIDRVKQDFLFDIKRVFYIYDVDHEDVRGRHANKNTRFILIALTGSVTIYLTDGVNEKDVVLNDLNEGLLIERRIWKEMKYFEKGTILLCLCSEEYDPNEYIFEIEDIKAC